MDFYTTLRNNGCQFFQASVWNALMLSSAGTGGSIALAMMLHPALYNNTKKKKKKTQGEKEAKGGLIQRSRVTWKQVVFAVVGKSPFNVFGVCQPVAYVDQKYIFVSTSRTHLRIIKIYLHSDNRELSSRYCLLYASKLGHACALFGSVYFLETWLGKCHGARKVGALYQRCGKAISTFYFWWRLASPGGEWCSPTKSRSVVSARCRSSS